MEFIPFKRSKKRGNMVPGDPDAAAPVQWLFSLKLCLHHAAHCTGLADSTAIGRLSGLAQRHLF